MLNPAEPAILLVEDNPVDVMLMRRAFRELEFSYRLAVVGDGAQAIQYLNGEGPYAARAEFPFPNLLLLDLGLPHVDGFQVLRWLRSQKTLQHLPVIVLSGSSFSPDIKRAYAAGANSFLTKPSGLAELIGAMKGLTEYWLHRGPVPQASPASAQNILKLPQPETDAPPGRAQSSGPLQ